MRRNTRSERLGTAACLLAGLAAIGVVAAPAAQARSAAPARVEGINCSTPTIGFLNGQWYYGISCSAWGTTKWWVNVNCSDGSFRSDGPHTTFLNVQVYCPPNTTVTKGWVSYTP
ncbi:hypothetical protein ACIQWA_19540 [Kitasatospora sp. NPDC098652]|uniref:hypothetical protein n=1 Tax=Kitasatospora sp. NPDC098652 TaxID=3364095 RepID=UPI00382E8213